MCPYYGNLTKLLDGGGHEVLELVETAQRLGMAPRAQKTTQHTKDSNMVYGGLSHLWSCLGLTMIRYLVFRGPKKGTIILTSIHIVVYGKE